MSLQERLEIIRSSPAPRNEESAKFQILAPILHSLGWDPSEVDLEYSAGGKRSGGRIDMALKTSRQIVALIEAKAPVSRVNVSCSVGGLSLTQGDEHGEGFEEEP